MVLAPSLHHPGFAQAASRPDALRISGLSTALALHVIALGLLLVPARVPPGEATATRTPVTFVPALLPPPPPPPAVKAEVTHLPRPSTTPHPPAQPPRAAQGHATQASNAQPVTPDPGPIPPDTKGDGDVAPPVDPGPPAAVSLQYLRNPAPTYPRAALQMRIEGTVVLEVTVDAEGVPVSVTIAASSGSRDLDRVAREQVLKAWRFRPAMIGGHAVAATGRVPVVFRLAR